ncbi:MAG: hypothetical protein ACE5JH_10035 [Acidobacteriota bacterium]
MALHRQERLVLTLPPDPQLARLTRRVTYHFCRQNGIRIPIARKGSRTVERLCRDLLRRAAGRAREGGRAVVVILTTGLGALEVTGRRGSRGRAHRLIRLPLPDAA